jgi:hypothetical protein
MPEQKIDAEFLHELAVEIRKNTQRPAIRKNKNSAQLTPRPSEPDRA